MHLYPKLIRLALCSTALMALLCGCGTVTKPPADNRTLLGEMTRAGTWFHARKTRPIWAKPLEHRELVQTLEGPIQAEAGDYLCRGAGGELWPLKSKTLSARYLPSDELTPDGWRRYVPRPDSEGVWAAQVPHPFTVLAPWGRLSGKSGDYLVMNYRDRQQPCPEDVWVVDQSLFRATYERVGP